MNTRERQSFGFRNLSWFSARFGKENSYEQFICEFPGYEAYGPAYRRLANTLGRPARQPEAEELERVQRLIERRANPVGSLNIADCLFLAAFVSIIRPHRMLEIGTGSGFSSALLACIIELQRPNTTAPFVDTLDKQSEYFGDCNLPVGFEVANLIPDSPGSVRIHRSRESDFVGSLAGKDELELAFIDGNHQHPCPLLDLLRLAPFVRGGGWILLHDIRLGSIVETLRKKGVNPGFGPLFGAEWLFDKWTWNKVYGGNIGAIQLPLDKKTVIRRSTRELINLPFEVCAESYPRLRREVREAARACAA